MQTSLFVPHFRGKMIEATVSPQMKSKHNLQLVTQRFLRVYQSCSIIFSHPNYPTQNLTRNLRKSRKRESGLLDRPIRVVNTHEPDPKHVENLAETRFSEIPRLQKRSTWILRFFRHFQDETGSAQDWREQNDTIVLLRPSFSSSICFQNNSVPFL